MREIKFRAWDIESKVMHYNVGLEPLIIKVYDSFENGARIPHVIIKIGIDLVKVMQYTGLKDKNGAEIYEGDILDYSFYKPDEEEPKNGVVVYDKDSASYSTENIWEFNFRMYWSHPDFKNLKVIGNIHENPELLEEECETE